MINSPTLLEDLREGQEQGLKAVFDQYNQPLFFFALQFVHNRAIAEEIVADAFIKVWERKDRFESENKLKAFLYIAVKNACLNHLRKPAVEINTDFDNEFTQLIDEDTNVLYKIIKAELIKTISDELNNLPEKQRIVFKLSYFDDLDATEISQKLGMSLSAVYTNKSRALAALRVSFGTNSIALFLLSIITASS